MKRILFLCTLLCITCYSYAQTITVLDRENSAPLQGAVITGGSPPKTVTTDAAGKADIADFSSADQLEVRNLGFETLVLSYSDLEAGNHTLYLTREGISLDHVVISATKSMQSARDVPNRITKITSREVALQNPQTAADMLGVSGEVFIQKSQQGGGSPMIRGFSTNRLLYAVDGVRMNTAIFRSGNLQNVISLDPFAIESTEVFFGPGSVIYGSDAIGGVMSFQTLTPNFSQTADALISGSALARYSSANNEKTGHFDLNLGWKKFASVTSFSYFDYGDLRMGIQGPDEYLRPFYVQRADSADVIVANDDPLIQKRTAYTQMNLMQKFRYAPNEEWDISYGFHYSESSDYDRYDRLIRTSKGAPRSAEWYYGPQVWMMNNLGITHNGANGIYDVATLRLAHQLFKESRIDRDFNDAERRTRAEKVNAYSANLDFTKSLGKTGKSNLFYGLEAVLNDIVSTGTDEDITTGVSVPGPARYPQSTWSSYAAYASYQHHFSRLLTVQAGARYNTYRLQATFDTSFYPFPFTTADMKNGALTGSIGAVLRPNSKWAISLNLSTGFRSPNVDDAGKVFDSEPGAVVLPNPNLKEEYAYNAEAGIAKVFGNNVKVDVTGYYTILENALVRRNSTFNGQDSIIYDGTLSQVQAIQNAAKASIFGIQAGLEVRLPKGFTLSSKLNYQKGEEELDDGTTSPLRHAAPMFGITSLRYSKQKLLLDLYTVYNAKRDFEDLPAEEQGKDYLYSIDENGNPYSPGWYTLNFKAMYQLTDKLTVTTGLENITDRRYRPYSSGLVASGRNFIISLRATL